MVRESAEIGLGPDRIVGITLGLAVGLFILGAGVTGFEQIEPAAVWSGVGLLFYPLRRTLTELQRLRAAVEGNRS